MSLPIHDGENNNGCWTWCPLWVHRSAKYLLSGHFKTHPYSKRPKELNAFQHMVLTSLVMNFNLNILQYMVVSLIDGKLESLDPLHFAYPTGEAVEDANLPILDSM